MYIYKSIVTSNAGPVVPRNFDHLRQKSHAS